MQGLSIWPIGATFSLQPRNRLQHVQHLPLYDHSLDASDLEEACIRRLEGGRRRRCLTQYAMVPFRRSVINMTGPLGGLRRQCARMA